jgi:hypothetical protein
MTTTSLFAKILHLQIFYSHNTIQYTYRPINNEITSRFGFAADEKPYGFTLFEMSTVNFLPDVD